MSNTTKLLINHMFCHLMIIPGAIYGQWWMFLAALAWWYVVAIVSISGGYHRFYSHSSFEGNKFFEVCVNILGIFSGAGPALTWAATHRQHHAYSDTDLDSHSHIKKGKWSVYVNTWGYDFQIKRRFIKKYLRNPILVHFYKNYFMYNLFIMVAFFLVDPLLLVFGYCMPVVFAFHGYGLLNVLGHSNGKPTNSWFANLLTAGEGWHEEHHKKAAHYRIGREKGQWDPTAWFIEYVMGKKV